MCPQKGLLSLATPEEVVIVFYTKESRYPVTRINGNLNLWPCAALQDKTWLCVEQGEAAELCQDIDNSVPRL